MPGPDAVTEDSDVGHPIAHLIRTYAGTHAVTYAVGAAALVIARVPQRVPALLIGVALDALLLADRPYAIPFVPQSLIPDATLDQLWFTAGVLAAAVLAQVVLDWIADYLIGSATLQTLHDVRVGTYDAVMGLEMSYFDETQRGDVMSVLNNDVNNLEDVSKATVQALTFGTEILVAFAFMLALQWQLALAVAAIPLVIAATSRIYASLLEPRYDAVRESVGRVNARLEDAIDGVGTVKAFTREDGEAERVADASGDYRDAKWASIRLRLAYDASTWVLARTGGRALLLLGGYWVLAGPPLFFSGSLSPGTLLTFLMYSRSFLFPVRNLAVRVIDRYENGLASAKRVVGVLTHPAVVDEDDDAPALRVDDGRVEYEDVSFAYDGATEPTVEDVSFAVEPGELVGVVGSTGAGKSTLVKLLFRFYDPDEGMICVDGREIESVSVESLREAVGYVSQDPFLFYGTVRENVAYAAPDADDEAVVDAAKLAGAHEFVEGLPEGYDTQVGERGVKLSGGQRQRIAIARAIVRDPEILVLDEATSHVDNETELQIQRSLDSLAGERTTFAIAHRLSTVRDADRVLVVDDGRLVETGTHEDLLAADGVYADLWRVQVGDVNAAGQSVGGADAGEVAE